MYTINANMFFNSIVILYSSLLVLIATAIAIPPEPEIDAKKADFDNKVTVSLNLTHKETSSANANNNITSHNTSKTVINEEINVIAHDPDYSALRRLFYVLLGLCSLIMVYVSYHFYRSRKPTTRPTTVRKYGVLTQRTDIEMLPLPIDDDEEDDDTVFDVGNHMNRWLKKAKCFVLNKTDCALFYYEIVPVLKYFYM